MVIDADAPMRRALALGWEAFRAGCFPVGAVVVDSAGEVVAEGRNRIGDADAPPGRLRGVALAHAEMDVLAQLPWGVDYSGHTLFTSLEPCLLCRSATIMAGIGRVRFLAADPICRGLERLGEINEHARRNHPEMVGPQDGVDARFSGALAMAVVLHANDMDAAALAFYERSAPGYLSAAKRIVADGLWPSRRLDLDAAIAALTPLLAAP